VEDRKLSRHNSGVYCNVSIFSLLQKLKKKHSHEISLKQNLRKRGQYLRFHKSRSKMVTVVTSFTKIGFYLQEMNIAAYRETFLYSFQFRFILL
jgi:hypothetical protein